MPIYHMELRTGARYAALELPANSHEFRASGRVTQ
jgi:hypothetical protein